MIDELAVEQDSTTVPFDVIVMFLAAEVPTSAKTETLQVT
jgi:hypothetical protein